MANTPDSAPRLTLHVLTQRTLKQTSRYELPMRVGTTIRTAVFPDAFSTGSARGGPFWIYHQDKGLIRLKRHPAQAPPVVLQTKTGIGIVGRAGRQHIRLPGKITEWRSGYLLNGGKSMVALTQNHTGLAGSLPGTLWLIEDLAQPRPVKLDLKLKPGRGTRIIVIGDKTLFVAAGPLSGPITFYEVNPFRGKVRKLSGFGNMRDVSVLLHLPRAHTVVVLEGGRVNQIVLYDTRSKRARTVELPPGRWGLRVLSRRHKPELVAVGDQLIDVQRARIVGKVPVPATSTAWVYDPGAALLYYATSSPVSIQRIRIHCYDLRRKREVGQVELKQVGHHLSSSLKLDKVYALQLRPDGTVLAVAGGLGYSKDRQRRQ